MKVLYSCLSRSWGGMEMFAVNAVLELLKRDIETHLVCYPGSKIEQDALKKGIKVHPVKAKGYFNPGAISKLSSVIKKEKYDVVHSQYSKDLWVLVPSLKLARSNAALLMTKQLGSYVVKKDFLHRWVYNRLDYALAISKVIQKNLVDTCPVEPERVKLLHNAVDTNKFDPADTRRDEVRTEFGIKENEIVIGMLARFSPGKGHEDYLKAAGILTKEYNNLKFMIVGEPSRGEDNYGLGIVEMSKTMGLEDKVIFTGFRSDTPDVISSMDIFAFPSHNEAFGIALAEAMAMEKPTVVSNADGVLDIAVDGETGWLFQVKDENDLAAKLKQLIDKPEDCAKFGKQARQRIIDHFELDLLTRRAISIYEEAIAEKGNK